MRSIHMYFQFPNVMFAMIIGEGHWQRCLRRGEPGLQCVYPLRDLMISSAGPPCTEEGHGEDICHENFEKGSNAAERSGNATLRSHWRRHLTKSRKAGSCPCRTRRSCRIQFTLGCPTVLFIPGSRLSISHHGISSGWRSDDHAHQI
jgi:hypothetical protein